MSGGSSPRDSLPAFLGNTKSSAYGVMVAALASSPSSSEDTAVKATGRITANHADKSMVSWALQEAGVERTRGVVR